MPPPGPTSPGPPPNWPLTRKRSRKRLVITAISALVVLAVLAGLGVFAVSKFSGPDAAQRAAQERDAARLVGQHYLEALAAGDARTALSLSAQQPATPQLLTDKALVDQLSATPISAITVSNDPAPAPGGSPDDQRVVLSAHFGPTPSQAVMTAHKIDGQWKLGTTTIAVTVAAPPNSAAAMKTLTVAGALTNGASPISIFPGTPQVSSANRYIDITAPTAALLLEALTATPPPTITPAIALNDAGRQASLDAVDRRLHYCFAGVAPPAGCCPPGGCPLISNTGPSLDPDSLSISGSALDGTANIKYELDPNTMKVHVTGDMHYNARGTHQSQPITFRQTWTVDSTVDLTTEPPVYVPKPPN
jgi:type II secretory pathway pseudopilin PulG